MLLGSREVVSKMTFIRTWPMDEPLPRRELPMLRLVLGKEAHLLANVRMNLMHGVDVER